MARPFKCRRVEFVPNITFFKPAGVPMRMLQDVCISLEETESIRLRDIEALEQQECAERMNISRPTFQRVLRAARFKIADALLNGKAIRIEGGNFELASSYYRCIKGHEWEINMSSVKEKPCCPICKSSQVQPSIMRFEGRVLNESKDCISKNNSNNKEER
ncbi:MAG: DUF134 domain-containing protein [Chloroflexi bacterium]|nr:DUF134 domain-containing protein [Chloroflexota bacterium]